jgi:hypothetical protein
MAALWKAHHCSVAYCTTTAVCCECGRWLEAVQYGAGGLSAGCQATPFVQSKNITLQWNDTTNRLCNENWNLPIKLCNSGWRNWLLVDFSFIALMMEAVSTSETSVNFNVTTWRYIPKDSKLLVTGYSYVVLSYKTSHALRPFSDALFSPHEF